MWSIYLHMCMHYWILCFRFVSSRFKELQTELLSEHEAALESVLVENRRLNAERSENRGAVQDCTGCVVEKLDISSRTVSAISTAASICVDERGCAETSTRQATDLDVGTVRTVHEAPPLAEYSSEGTGNQVTSLAELTNEIGTLESLDRLPEGPRARRSSGSSHDSDRSLESNRSKNRLQLLPQPRHTDRKPTPFTGLLPSPSPSTVSQRPSRSLRFSFQPMPSPNNRVSALSQDSNGAPKKKESIIKSALAPMRKRENSQFSQMSQGSAPTDESIPEGGPSCTQYQLPRASCLSYQMPVSHTESNGSRDSTLVNCDLRLHGAWRRFFDENDLFLRRTLSRQPTNVMDIYKEAEAEEDPVNAQNKTWFTRHIAVSPTSKRRLLWDLMSFLFVSYDAVVIPLQFFDPPETDVTGCFAHSARVFWTIDIIWSFITIQMNVDGEIETSFWVIAYHYITTWFLFDLFIVVVDWLDYLSSIGGNSTNSSSAIRSMRVLRAIRLLRLMRLVRNSPEISRLLAQYIRSERTKVVFGVGQIAVIVIGIAHVIACCWYGVSVNTDGDSWVKEHDLENASLQARYVSSFYWSMVQFTGSGIMVPANNAERVFGCFVLMVAFMISVSIVSSLTTLMTRLQLITAQTTRQLSVLHRYLIDHKISSKLASRVQRNASHALAELRKNTPETGVELLELLSKPLRVELRFEVKGPVLMAHPFFSCYSITNPGGIRQVCFTAVSDLTLSAGDIVFNKAEKVDDSSMLFVLKGKLKYTLGDDDENHRLLECGQWISEAVLWVEDWPLQGSLRAKSECKLLCLHAKDFQQTSAKFRTSEFYVAQYAAGFLQDLNLVKRCQLTDVAEDIINIGGVVRSIFPEEVANKLKTKHNKRGSSLVGLAGFMKRRGSKNRQVQDGKEWTLSRSGTASTDSLDSVYESEIGHSEIGSAPGSAKSSVCNSEY